MYIGKVKYGDNTWPLGSTLYGTCDTAAATAAKVVTMADFDELITGITIHVKFTYSNTVASPTLKVNSTAAKSIVRYGTTAPSTSASTSWNAGSVISFTYDGTYWCMNDWMNTDSNTDTKVTLNLTSSSNTYYRPLLIGATSTSTLSDENIPTDLSSLTDTALATHNICVKPNTGALHLGHVVAYNGGGSYYKARDLASVVMPKASNTSTYYPVFDVKTYQGDWSVGTLGNGGEYLYFLHRYDTNYSSANNSKFRKYRLVGSSSTTDTGEYNIVHTNINVFGTGKPMTSGEVVVADGTDGAVTTTGYTIAKSVPSNAVFTDTNTTYTIAVGDSNGLIKVTPSSGNAYNVSVKGWTSWLPLTGGTLLNSKFGAQLVIERTDGANMAAIGFKNTSGMLGYIATNIVDGSFVRYKGDASTYYTILDSSNSSVSLSGQTLTVKINGTSKSLTNTTYSDFVGSGSTAAAGLVPKPSTTAGTTKFLREDGSWSVPTDTNTDTKVTQTLTTSSNTDYRPILVGYSSSAADSPTFATATNTAYATHKIYIKPGSGDLHFNTTGSGIWFRDSASTKYAAIYENGSNLWIGANLSSGTHHTGSTYISAGSGYVYISKLVNNTRSNYINLDAQNYSSYALPLSGGTMSNTNLVTNMNADLLDGQHGTYYATASSVTTLQGYFYTGGIAKTAKRLPVGYGYDGGEGITNPYHLMGQAVVSGTGARNITGVFLVASYYGHSRGILLVQGRVDSGSTINSSDTYAKWIVKDKNLDVTNFILTTKVTSNSLTCRLYYKVTSKWGHARITLLDDGSWASPTDNWTLYTSSSDTAGDYVFASIPSGETLFVSVDNTSSKYADISKYLEIITGTGATASDGGASDANRYKPAKWTFDKGVTVSTGNIFLIKTPCAGHSYGVYMSVNNGDNYYPIVVAGTSRLTTHYGTGLYILVIFDGSGSAADIFPINGGTSRLTVNNGVFRVLNYYDSGNTYTSAICTTGGGTAAKTASCSYYAARNGNYIHVIIAYANSYSGAITLNINSTGAKPIYINGNASSASNYTLPAGSYLVYYNGTNYYFRIDGVLQANITGNSGTATKLATARTLWGLSFNGSANVTGTLTGCTSIDSLLYFDTTNSRIGIGTASPSQKLDVNGTVGLSGINFSNSAGVTMDEFGNIKHKTTTSSNYWHVDTNSGTSIIAATTGGQVGIGTVSISSDTKLEVAGLIRATGINSRNNANDILYILCDDLGDGNVIMADHGDNAKPYVGIGRSPSYKLDINGICRASNITNTSDERIKDIYSNVSIKVDDIANSPLFLFKWKTGADKNKHVGTSAQYWKTKIPELVSKADDDIGTLSLEYGVLGVANSISIAKEVVSLKEEIKLLQALIAELKLLLNN